MTWQRFRRGGLSPQLRKFDPGSETVTNFDRLFRARIGKQSLGLSPPGLMLVYLDWLVHLGFSPGKRLELLGSGLRDALRLALFIAAPLARRSGDAARSWSRRPSDRRFTDPAWRTGGLSICASSRFLLDAAVVAGGNDRCLGGCRGTTRLLSRSSRGSSSTSSPRPISRSPTPRSSGRPSSRAG